MPASTAPRHVRVLLAAVVASTACAGARAQGVTPQYNTELEPQNFALASFLGSGYYDVGGRQIYILRVTPGINLRSVEEQPWGLRLTLRSAVGFYDFRSSDEGDFGLPSSVGSASMAPGVEFRVPIFAGWRLEPFAEAGPAMEFETDELTWIYGVGAKSRAEFDPGRGRILLWNTLLWAGNWASDVSPADDFGVFETTVEWRHPIPLKLWGRPTDIGPLFRSELYFDALRVDPPQGRPRQIRRRYEAGVYWGTVERTKKLKIPIPRLGLAVRFGNGDTGFRFGLTSRF